MCETLYLLTGGTGLLGGNIVRALTVKGARVRTLALPKDPAVADLPAGVEVAEGDLLDDEALDRFFAAPQGTQRIVIHAASIVTVDPKPNEKVWAVNVEGTRNIVRKCLQHGAAKLIYVSSTSAIPELPVGQAIREIARHDPERVIGFYAKTKAVATDLVLEAACTQNLDASVVCPSGIFGPNDYGFGMITSCVRMIAEGGLRVSIDGTFNSVDARDLADGILACAQKGRRGETYIMASRCYTFDQLMDAICRKAGVKDALFTAPLWLARPFAPLGTLYGKIAKKPAWFSRFTLYNLSRNNDYDAGKAERELGFKCRQLEDSIADTIDWLREIHKLGPAQTKAAR